MAGPYSLTFPQLTLRGYFGPIMDAVPEIQEKRTKFAGVRGTSVLALQPGGRELTCECWLCNGWESQSAIVAALNELAVQAGQLFGTLTVPGSAGIARTWPNCIFMGFEKLPPGILQDVAGTLEDGANNYFVHGILKFYQTLTSYSG